MISIEIANGTPDRVRALVPPGVENYIVRKGDTAFLNVRTQDRGLIDRLRSAAAR